MTKAEARQIIDSMGLTEPQIKAARRAIVRATTSEDIAITRGRGAEIVIARSRAGHDGRQVFEDTVYSDGSKKVVQKAYDAAGNLVHFDPKGGSP